MTDNEILDKIYDDTVSGLTMLADTYSSLVYKIVYDILSDVATQKDIEECVCDVFVAFCNTIDDVDLDRGSIIGYLGVIARRFSLNLYYTICPDDDSSFDEYTVEEMSEMLENQQAEENADISDMVLSYCLKEIVPEEAEHIETEYEEPDEDYITQEDEPTEDSDDTQEDISEETYEADDNGEVIIESKGGHFGRVLKTLVAMVTLVLVITVGVIAFDKINTARQEATTTTQPTTQAQSNNHLLSAILSGNDKLIEQLIANSLLLSQDVLKFAVESADKISYDSLRRMAEEVRNKYGSTGLDPILEGAIFGDFQSVADKLKDKDESEMTPAEKLAYFFMTNFGNVTG